jgi:hypothetical protein
MKELIIAACGTGRIATRGSGCGAGGVAAARGGSRWGLPWGWGRGWLRLEVMNECCVHRHALVMSHAVDDHEGVDVHGVWKRSSFRVWEGHVVGHVFIVSQVESLIVVMDWPSILLIII